MGYTIVDSVNGVRLGKVILKGRLQEIVVRQLAPRRLEFCDSTTVEIHIQLEFDPKPSGD